MENRYRQNEKEFEFIYMENRYRQNEKEFEFKRQTKTVIDRMEKNLIWSVVSV